MYDMMLCSHVACLLSFGRTFYQCSDQASLCVGLSSCLSHYSCAGCAVPAFQGWFVLFDAMQGTVVASQGVGRSRIRWSPVTVRRGLDATFV
jgi:hypothetical protein